MKLFLVRHGETEHNVAQLLAGATDSAMEPPVCWITNAMDRSPAEMLFVPAGSWGPLSGSLLSLSYGYGKVFIVPREEVGGVMQGGVSPLPRLIAPDSVPAFAEMRLLAIWMLWFQPCR